MPEYLSSVSSDGYVDNERNERQLLDNDSRETEVCKNFYQAYKIIGFLIGITKKRRT